MRTIHGPHAESPAKFSKPKKCSPLCSIAPESKIISQTTVQFPSNVAALPPGVPENEAANPAYISFLGAERVMVQTYYVALARERSFLRAHLLEQFFALLAVEF